MRRQQSIRRRNNDKPLIGIVAPDSFKGSLSSEDAARCISQGFRSVYPNVQILETPLADGGEGSSEIVGRLLSARRLEVPAFNPLARKHNAFFYLDDQKRAYIEFAASSGITLVEPTSASSRTSTSYGTGCLIKSAIDYGAKEIFLFLGGSATTDGGVGMARALGYRFLNIRGEEITTSYQDTDAGSVFPGEQLDLISSIEPGEALTQLAGVSVIGIADVRNPLCGDNGAATVYGPQKGANASDVKFLDHSLSNLAAVVERDLHLSFSKTPGAGAAGGAGFGVLSFLNGDLRPGPRFFLDIVGFDKAFESADFVVTGEGCVDSQSLHGKLLGELIRRTANSGKPLISLAGCISLRQQDLKEHPHLLAFGLGHRSGMSQPGEALELLAYQVASLLKMNPSRLFHQTPLISSNFVARRTSGR